MKLPVRNSTRLAPWWYACGCLLLLLVAILSLMTFASGGPQVNDKLAHFLTYSILSGWFSLLVTRWQGLPVVWLGLAVFGITIEGLQGLTEHRSAEWADVVANSLGAAIGLLVFFTALPRLLRLLDARLATLVGR